MVLVWISVGLVVATIIWEAAVNFGLKQGAIALDEERKISAALRAGFGQLTKDEQAVYRRIREYAAQVSLDVKKIAPWLVIVLMVGIGAAHAQASAQYRHHGSATLQDPAQTPGVVDAQLTETKLCDPAFHTGTVRNVTESQKVRICRAYGITAGCPGKGYEIDHLVSIELGGANEDGNLWPQPADAPGLIGYHTKDVVENRAHRAVCQGLLSLADAQIGIRTDWYAFGLENGFIGVAKLPKGQKRTTAP